MDISFISAFSGLAGAAIGGLASFSTTWLTQQSQLRDRHREADRAEREALFNEFITEASRLYGDALGHVKDDPTDLVRLYALVARLRLLASEPVVLAAGHTLDCIIETYLAPNLTLHELRGLANTGGMDFLLDFGRACREELRVDAGHPRRLRAAGTVATPVRSVRSGTGQSAPPQ